jgi:hypothetical protein
MDVGQEEILMNTTVRLDCSDERCPHNWRLRWQIPEGGELVSLKDSRGPIEDYSIEGNGIVATSNQDDERDPETFKMTLLIDREAEEVYDGLYKRELSLRSFEGSKTSGRIHVDNLLSGWTGHGVNSSFRGNNLSFKTEGPLTFRVKFGEGYSTEYYEFFGGRPENSSLAFEVAAGTTGQVLTFDRLPVALLPDELFNETVSRWSSGEYISGSAKMRQGLEEEFLPVLAHETVHALNARELKWDDTSSSYFEEGTSRYVESMVAKKIYAEGSVDRVPRELFGESVRYDPDPSDNYYSTIPPKGSADVLWGYYQNDEDFMKRWNPFDSPAEYRGFGYAYSELMIKNYVLKHNESLRQLYSDLDVREKVNDPEEKWQIFSEHLDTTPCKYESRERFEQCLEKINKYNYTVYSASPSMGEDGELEIEKLKVPEREDKGQNPPAGDVDLQLRETGKESVVSAIGDAMKNALDQLIKFLRTELT